MKSYWYTRFLRGAIVPRIHLHIVGQLSVEFDLFTGLRAAVGSAGK